MRLEGHGPPSKYPVYNAKCRQKKRNDKKRYVGLGTNWEKCPVFAWQWLGHLLNMSEYNSEIKENRKYLEKSLKIGKTEDQDK